LLASWKFFFCSLDMAALRFPSFLIPGCRQDRVRVRMSNGTVVVSKSEVEYMMYMMTMFSSPVPWLRNQTNFLRHDIGMTAYEVRSQLTGHCFMIAAAATWLLLQPVCLVTYAAFWQGLWPSK
jgi:hypothetical protein